MARACKETRARRRAPASLAHGGSRDNKHRRVGHFCRRIDPRLHPHFDSVKRRGGGSCRPAANPAREDVRDRLIVRERSVPEKLAHRLVD
eukprot:scaffold24646_cov129-Isochrysis_galbana.AAC.9